MRYLLHVATMQGLLLLAYYLLLDREPLGHLKRGYLLIGLLLPLAIPYWTVHWVELPPTYPSDPATMQVSETVPTGEPTEGPSYLSWLYWTGVLVAAWRFCYALGVIIRQLRVGEGTGWEGGAYWVSVPGLGAVHSFGPWVFYPRGNRPAGVVALHELAHVRQGHSLDRILVALLRVACWFNPLVYLYEGAIIRNHELLADRWALFRSGITVTNYQRELLAALTHHRPPALGSGLSFTSTKYRFLMLRTSTSSPYRLLLKGLFVSSLWIGLLVAFGATVYGQGESTQGTSSEAATHRDRVAPPPGPPSWTDPTRWDELDGQERARRALAIHMANSGRVITQSELDEWSDATTYGVWLDGQRIDKVALRSLNPADLHGAHVSKLMPNAVNFDDHRYQVDLTTKAAYAAKLRELRANAPGC